MFDYKGFEDDIVQQMRIILDKWIRENNDLYIFSLDCSRGMDSIGVIANTSHYLEEQVVESDSKDYWYYKYCEEEWDLFDTFEIISANMRKYLEDNSNVFTNPETQKYTEVFNQHCDRIIECCKNGLVQFRQFINQDYLNILLTFNVREYLDGKEKIKIFESINNKSTIKEYAEHIEEFA